MKRIFKYSLAGGNIAINLPAVPDIIHAGQDGEGRFCVWVEVDPERAVIPHSFYVLPTGGAVPNDAKHVSTFSEKDTPWIWHVYYTT